MLEEKIQQDLKTALLAGNKHEAETLRGLKSALLYAKVAANKRDTGLSEPEVMAIISKEAKKRQESADLYVEGGNSAKAADEQTEKTWLVRYLPVQLSEEAITKLIDAVIQTTGASDVTSMGRVIAAVKQQVGATADGGVIARLTKERLSQ